LERRLAEGPVISVPAITLEGDANSAPHPEPSAYAGSSRAPTRTGRSRAASGTTFPRKRRRGPHGWRWRGVTVFSSLRTAGSLPIEGHLPSLDGQPTGSTRRRWKRCTWLERSFSSTSGRTPASTGPDACLRSCLGREVRA
jgi:hypothetical protein